jgi:excisionase family DNA binding protein
MNDNPLAEIEHSVTPPEIAKSLGKDVHEIHKLIRSGKLRAWNLGNGTKRPRYRVPISALQEFLRSCEVTPPTPRLKRTSKPKPATVDYVAMMRLGRDRR